MAAAEVATPYYNTLSLRRRRSGSNGSNDSNLQGELRQYFSSLNRLTKKIVQERDTVATSHEQDWNFLADDQRDELIREHFVPSKIRELYPRLSRRWGRSLISDSSLNMKSSTDADSCVRSTVLVGFQVCASIMQTLLSENEKIRFI